MFYTRDVAFININHSSNPQRSSQHEGHNHEKNKDCVSISTASGFWYDAPLCMEPLRFICQAPKGGANHAGTNYSPEV